MKGHSFKLVEPRKLVYKFSPKGLLLFINTFSFFVIIVIIVTDHKASPDF